MPHRFARPATIEMWAGIECTVNRVHGHRFDQVARSGHDLRLDDLERFATLGIRAIRYPVLWERMAPHSIDDIDWRWSDERLYRLRDLGIRPIVGLVHHGSGPSYTSLMDDGFPEQLARFGRAIAARYPWVTDFTPVNEPLTTARFSGLYGHWYPHGANDTAFVRALIIQLRAVSLAMRAIREVTPRARLIQTEDCGRCFGTETTRSQVQHEEDRRWLTWDLLIGSVTPAHPLRRWLRDCGAGDGDLSFFTETPCPPALLGLNYYLTSDRYLDERLQRYPSWSHGGNGKLQYADVEAVRAREEGIVGHEAHLMSAWERYAIPVAVTEVHLSCSRDEQMRWLLESWHGAHRARACGADVRAVTAWALLGSFDWNSLVTCDAGHYEPGVFDLRSPVPRATALASMVQQLASGSEPHHPVLATPGWWRRPDRLIHGGIPSLSSSSAGGQPILIVGSGMLGRAFQRLCSVRGLSAQLAGRPDVDIADPVCVDAILRKLRPWAVVNAAGFTRVDDAEHEQEACWRANVTGLVNLAAACGRRGLPLVTFSSAHVFDGRAVRPYTEEDAANPLNVYGASQAAAEARVRALLPGVLVIRTSTCFDGRHEADFLACLLRSLDAEQSFPAPADSIVSPTYVPHLVHATLDLLIDGESGIWHLTNGAAVTWLEFACEAAARCNRDTELITPAVTRDIWGPAIRPAQSALSSVRGCMMPSLVDALSEYADARRAESHTALETCVLP